MRAPSILEEAHDRLGVASLRLESARTKIDKLDDDMSTNNAAVAIRALREVKDLSEELAKMVKEAYDELAKEIVPQIFKEAGVTSITKDGFRFTISETLRASIKEGQKEAAFEWLRANDLEDIIIETVNASTLSSTLREIIGEEGQSMRIAEMAWEDAMQEIDIPLEIFNCALIPGVSITKAK